ncbi:MAG TPA: TIGR03619 family F420-dependent LLM class oxidoreductase [Acidimicrobiales bacterium]
MDLGLTIFATDQTMAPADLAREAEARGFSSLWVPEHTHIPVSRVTPAPAGEPMPEEYKRTLDPFVALSMAAAVTTTLRLGTGIALPAQRDPITTAKECATLDHLSGGRLSYGIGYGWNIDELEDHGGTKATRRAVTRERVLAMQSLWADEVGSFDGEHVHLSPSWAWPKPQQTVKDGRTGVPVFLGGAPGPILFRHIAEYGDGWLPIGGAGMSAALADLSTALDAVGRRLEDLAVIPFGTLPDRGKLDHYTSLGVTETVLRLPSAGRDEVLRTLDAYDEFLDR